MGINKIEGIVCKNYNEIYYVSNNETKKIVPSPFANEKEVHDFLNKIFSKQGKEISYSNPTKNEILEDGSRISAVMSNDGISFTINGFKGAKN